MGHWVELWTRPGDANFGRIIDSPPFREASWHDGMNLVGDGTMQMPSSYDRFDEILFIDRTTLANSTATMARVFSGPNAEVVGEWLVSGMEPTSSKTDPYVDVFGLGIKSILSYARTESYDWDGSDNWAPRFPDWIYGGPNILSNPGFEDQTFNPRIYWLLIDATAGSFTLSDGTDTTSALPWDTSDGFIEGQLESDITAIDDISVTPLEGLPRGYELLITATGGTFTLTAGTTSGNLAFNISAAALETAIEGLSAITNVTVTAITIDGVPGFQVNLHTPATADISIDTTNLTDGSAQWTVSRSADGFAIEFITPPTGITLTVDDSALTGSARLQLVDAGEVLASGWMRSQQISAGTPREYGTYTSWAPSTAEAHTGSWSLRIDPAPITADIDRYAGAQQVVNVTPGGLYQASIWVRPTAAGQTYRLVIRGVDEDIVSTPLFAGNISPPANVWTQVVIPNITIPDGVTRVIFRFANIAPSGNPAPFYIDDAIFAEGQAAATVGKILGDLYDDATVDHAGRVVWEDAANPGTAYLTLDFTDALDSDGVAWDKNDLSVKIWQRMNYLQVMQMFVDDYGYEWRLVPDDVEGGSWLWQVYNPDGMDAAPDQAILGGSQDVNRQLRRFLPTSDHLVEGEDRITARAYSVTLRSVLGRIETSRLGRNLPLMTAVTAAAIEDNQDALSAGSMWSYELVNPQAEPGTDYRLGDTIAVHDPPEVDGDGRLWDWVLTMSSERETNDVQLVET